MALIHAVYVYSSAGHILEPAGAHGYAGSATFRLLPN